MIQLLLIFLFILPPGNPAVGYSGTREAIVISGADIAEILEDETISVYFGDVAVDTQTPEVIGSYSIRNGEVIFTPKYGFSQGATYTVIISSAKYASKKHTIEIPKKKPSAVAEIVAVYPTATTLPMNQLKLYVAFSAPMKVGHAFDHIQLFRLPNRTLEEDAFLVTPDELWDPEKRRLTILFDPGRIKRGVQPNLQLGLPLVEGNQYELVIDQNWLDANGATLINGFQRTFRVGVVDRKSPNPSDWIIAYPAIGKSEELRIDFNESMDYALLHSAIVVMDETGHRVTGNVDTGKHERSWRFMPDQTWQPGNYKILVSSRLEDLAGNNLSRKFDIDLNDPNDTPRSKDNIMIPFMVDGINQLKQNKPIE
jgi:hypothetical protein